MTVITKAQLARELGVSKARVTQYAKSGMPVRPDGKLNRDEALNHLRVNRVSEPGSTKGPVRAAKLLRSGPDATPAAFPEWITDNWSSPDRIKVEILTEFVTRVRPILAHAAIEAGASIEVAYAVTDFGQMDLLGVADGLLAEADVFGWRDDWFMGLTLPHHGPAPNWRRIAEALGVLFSEKVCKAYAAARPVMDDKPLLGCADDD